MNPADSHGYSYGAIKVALARIINLHNDFPAVVRENEDGLYSTNKMVAATDSCIEDNEIDLKTKTEKKPKKIYSSESYVKKAPNKKEGDLDNHDKTNEGVSIIGNELILEQIEIEAESLGVEVCVAARSMITAQVKLLAHLVQEGQDYASDLEGLITTTRFLVSRKILAASDIGEQLLKVTAFLSLPLACIWRFSSIGVVSLEQIIKSLHDNKHTSLSVTEDLLHLVLCNKENPENTSAVSEILAALIFIVYELAKDEHASLCRFANQILSSLTSRLLNHILNCEAKNGLCLKSQDVEDEHDHSEDRPKEKDNRCSDNPTEINTMRVLNIYELVLNNVSISCEALEGYCSNQLVQVLTHQPDLQLGHVLRNQENWRSTQANNTLSAWMWKLVVALGYEAALNTLDLVVANDEVNWACVLTLVATALNCHRGAITILKRMIEHNIRHGCENQEMESLVIGFLFARHASQEGRHIFPSYNQWFSSLFATESGSPAANKQAFVFLIRFLTDLVPHEPPYCLRAHVTSQIFTPKGCKEALRDYCYLARARLQELKDSLEDGAVAPQSLNANKVSEEVESSVKYYGEMGKIPNFILEASIFRKPYFRSAFLPALLTPRPMPDVPDARAKLIAALHSTGKIPSNMYSDYVESCKKEVSDLLTGVFIDVTEDIVIEEPISELSTMLRELVKESISSQEGGTTTSSLVLPILSRISGKLEEIMKFSDSVLRDLKYLTLDARKFSQKMVPYQVVEKIIETTEKICLISSPEKRAKKRPGFLSHFLSLLSTSVTLQCTLFTYLVHIMKVGLGGELVRDQIEIYGVILSELWKIGGLFLPVIEASAPDQKPQSFFNFFLTKLELHSQQASVFACSIMNSWLQWSLVGGENKDAKETLMSLPTQLLDLYCCLAPRLPLIYNRQNEREITVADVYSYLEGCNVPVCSRLYFSEFSTYSQKHEISIEKWILFELQTTWEDTPLDVRQAYLKCRVLQNFVPKTDTTPADGSVKTTSPKKDNHNTDCMSVNKLIIQIAFALLKVGLKEPNSSEILGLLQSLAHDNPDSTGICLLEEWHKRHMEGTAADISVLSFMSICGCLPPSLFLSAEQLLQLSGVLESLVNQILVATQDIQMNLHDTVFLCSSVLSAAASPGIKNLQVQQCFLPLRTSVVYHWESVSSFFKYHSDIIRRHSCLESLWRIMETQDKSTITSLTEEESGIRLLALCLRKSLSKKEMSEMASVVDTAYIKWLLAYLGLQQMRGSVPFFPDDKDLASNLNEQDKRVILVCQKELDSLLAITEPAKIVSKIFPSPKEMRLALKSVPTALVLVLLYNIVIPHDRSGGLKDGEDIRIINQFDLLLQCHIFYSNIYDCQENPNESSVMPKMSGVDNSDLADLEYLARLYQKILLHLPNISFKTLAKLSKNTFSKCDSDIKAAIKFHLQSN